MSVPLQTLPGIILAAGENGEEVSPFEEFIGTYINLAIAQRIPSATLETLGMVGLSGLGTLIFGLPLGLLLYSIGKGGLHPLPPVYNVASVLVNIFRSIPAVILIIMLIPITRLVMGSSLGWFAASFPLAIGAIPFFARLVETAAREVSHGKIEAALMLGASRFRVATGVILREALPSIVAAFTTTLIALVGASAISGILGGGGLGFMAHTYGYQRYETGVMILTVAILVILVQVIQTAGDLISRAVDHR